MPQMNISRSIVIDAPVNKVFPLINDFNHWKAWSPWLIMEPEATVKVAEDAKSYEWEGNRVGSGNMAVLEEGQNEYIHYDLNFLKPWKSKAKTSFFLSEDGDQTRVTWTMKSSLPFFLFWMKKMMESFVGGDYERGLDMLKAYAEDGIVPSHLDFKGFSTFEGCRWVGVRTTCGIDDTPTKMPEDFAKVWAFGESNPDTISGETLSIYHKWDLVKGMVSYTAAIQVKEIPSKLPEGFTSGSIPSGKTYVLRHVGRYQHLGNAWSTLYTMHRNKEFKPIKKVHPFEIYRNNPSNAAEKDLITDVHFMIR